MQITRLLNELGKYQHWILLTVSAVYANGKTGIKTILEYSKSILQTLIEQTIYMSHAFYVVDTLLNKCENALHEIAFSPKLWMK